MAVSQRVIFDVPTQKWVPYQRWIRLEAHRLVQKYEMLQSQAETYDFSYHGSMPAGWKMTETYDFSQ